MMLFMEEIQGLHVKHSMGEIEESKVWLKKYTDERPEVKTITDYRKVAPEMSEALTNNLIEGMKLAGLPE